MTTEFVPMNPAVEAPPQYAPIDPAEQRIIPAAPVVAERAERLNYSFGEMFGKAYEDFYKEVLVGSEKEMRRSAAAKVDEAKRVYRDAKMTELARTAGRALTMEDISPLLDPNLPENRPTDPETVAEDIFGNKYVKAMEDTSLALGGTFLDEAKASDPIATANLLRAGSSTIAKSQYLLGQVEDLETVVNNQGWAPWMADQSKSLFPGYNEYKQRGLVKKSNALAGFLLGNNLQEQSRLLWSIGDLDEFKNEFKRIIEPLKRDNPSLARDFAKAMWGQSTSDVVMNNLFTPIEFLAIGDAYQIGKGVVNAAKLRKQVSEATKQLAKSTTTPEQLEVKIAEAVGNIDEAAVKRTKRTFETNADPIKEALDSVSTYYRLDRDALETNTGNLSADLTTRIKDAFTRTESNLRTVLSEMLRVNRIPWATLTEDTIRIVKDTVRDALPGHRISDVGNPVHNPISNNHYVDVKVVAPDDKLFPTKQQAEKYMEATGITGKLESEALDTAQDVVSALSKREQGRLARLESEVAKAKKDLPVQMKNSDSPDLTSTDKAAAKRNVGRLSTQIARQEKEIAALNKKLKDNAVQTYYIPRAAAKAFEAVKVVDGQAKFYVDQGVEVVSSQTPSPGMIPVQVSPNGKVKFMPEVPEVSIEQQGLGWYIRLTKNIDERDPAILGLVRKADDAKSSATEVGANAWLRAATNWARTGADTMSKFELETRNNATYAKALLISILKEDMKYVKDVARGVVRVDPITGESLSAGRLRSLNPLYMIPARQRYNQFKKALENANVATDPVTKEQGYFFKTIGELEEFYQQTFHRPPSFEETQGYFATVRSMETDRVLRNLSIYRNKARLGTESHQISFTNAEGKRVTSDWIDGIVRGKVPGGEDDAILLDAKTGKSKELRLSSPMNKELRDRIERGELKVIELYDVYARPLSNFADLGDRVYRYVITDAVETKPLTYSQLNRRGGFHFDYDYGFYLKQASITAQRIGNSTRNIYEGDATAFALMNRAMGDDFAKHFNAARLLLKNGQRKEARDYVNANFPGIKFDDFAKGFRPSKNPEGRILPAKWSLDEPFMVVPKGKSIKDIDPEFDSRWAVRGGVKDGTKSGSLARQFQVEYSGERDSFGFEAIVDKGTARNPHYNVQPAEFVDPIDTLNRGLNRVVNSTFMDDYKVTSVTQWLEEAAPFLDADINEIRSAPFWYFKNAEFKRGPDVEVTWNLAQNRKKIRDFVGQPDWYETWAHRGTAILSDAMYRAFGPGKDVVPLWMLDKVADAPTIMRSFAVHAKLGLFAVPQLIVQNMSWVNMAAIAGIKEAGHGGIATMMHQWSRINRNPEFLTELSKKAEAFGWKPGEWLEANKTLMRTGFGNVGGEFADLNNAFKHTFIGNNAKDFLDLGQVIWKEAERNVRYGAWYIAFKEFRTKKPTGALSNKDVTEILARADLLSGNMSRAHNSIVQSGPFSLTTQFLSYQIRLAELFLGKRLGNTVQERMLARGRLLAWNAGAFGIPVATGVVGLPVSDAIRKGAEEAGYNPSENYISTMLMEGIPSMIMTLISGGGDLREGTSYNFGNRYGSPGFTQLRELLSSDKPWWHALGGASFSVATNTWANTDGFTRAMISMITGDQSDDRFALKMEDFVDVGKEITSINQTYRTLVALNTGKWLSRNEAYIGDVSAGSALLMGLSGLNLQDADSSYALGNLKKERDELYKDGFKLFSKEWRRGLRAVDAGDYDQASAFFRRSRAILLASGLPEEEYDKYLAIANKDQETLIQRAKWDYFGKNVQRGKEEQSLQTLQDWVELQRRKEGN